MAEITLTRRAIIAVRDLPHIPAPEDQNQVYDDAQSARRAARQILHGAGATIAYCWIEDHAFSWLRDQWRAGLALPPGITAYTAVYRDHYAIYGDDEFTCVRCARVTPRRRGYWLQRLCVPCAEALEHE